MAASCIFCKIIKGEIPSMKVFESDRTFAFLDINPLSYGHALVIPKFHGEIQSTVAAYVCHAHHLTCEAGAKLADIPDDSLQELLPVAKKIALASGAENYNILQNNGKLAHQVVDHVHGLLSLVTQSGDVNTDLHEVHMIPKPNEQEGLGINWPQQSVSKDKLTKLLEELKAKM